MLGKLLKYEIPAVGRQLAPMYLAWLAASILLGITIGRFDNSSFFIVIPVLVYFGVTVAVFVMAVVRRRGLLQPGASSIRGRAHPEQNPHGACLDGPYFARRDLIRPDHSASCRQHGRSMGWRTDISKLGRSLECVLHRLQIRTGDPHYDRIPCGMHIQRREEHTRGVCGDHYRADLQEACRAREHLSVYRAAGVRVDSG